MESDTLTFPFTMNWAMTRPGTVLFEKDEPFCSVIPIPKHYLPEWELALHDIADEPDLKTALDAFSRDRGEFLRKQKEFDPETVKRKWQKDYFVGRNKDGSTVERHVNKMRLSEPTDRRGQKPDAAR